MVTKEERKAVIRQQQGNLCYYCHKPLEDDGNNPSTLDHVIPISLTRGVGEVPNNLVCACYTCNQSKADRVPEGWDGRVGDWQLTDFGNWMWRGRR